MNMPTGARDPAEIRKYFGVIRQRIMVELGVQPTATFNPYGEAERRINFLMNYLEDNHSQVYVLGISGGIDSTTAGMLAQEAIRRLQTKYPHAEYRFAAVRLPYGVQRDEDEAQLALQTIKPDQTLTVDIKPAVDAMMAALPVVYDSKDHEDFVKGNVKARQRMVAQYALAGAVGGLVIGTDHNAEAVMGFFTKFGDGAADITPLAGLNKRQVRLIAKHLGVPDQLVNKVPTADLEDLDPGKPDEVAYGVTYDNIDDFLEGIRLDDSIEDKICLQFKKTIHKRELPVTPGL